MRLLKFITFLILFSFFDGLIQQFQQTKVLSKNSGVSTSGDVSIYGKTGFYNTANSMGGCQGQTSFLIEDSEIIFFFGIQHYYNEQGIARSMKSDHIWKYNISSNHWMFVKGRRSNSFPPQFVSINKYDSYNEIGGRTLSKGWMNKQENGTEYTFFGGFGTLISPYQSQTEWYLNELWRYSEEKNMFSLLFYPKTDNDQHSYFVSKGEFNELNNPGGRTNHEMVQLNEDETMLLMGEGFFNILSGKISGANLRDWWIYSNSRNQWMYLGGDNMGTYPFPEIILGDQYSPENNVGDRTEHKAIKINNEEVFLFGGYVKLNGISTASNLVQKYNISSNMWKYVSGKTTNGKPENAGYFREYNKDNIIAGRLFFGMWMINKNEIVVFGGNGYNDEWIFNLKNNFWKFTGRESTKIQNRYANLISKKPLMGAMHKFSAHFIPSRNEAIIVGGYGCSQFTKTSTLDTTWRVYYGNICNEIEESDPLVCLGRGICSGYNQCECQDGYFGSNCELTQCNGFLSNETDHVCSGLGVCYDIEKCACFETHVYTTSQCQENTLVKQMIDNFYLLISISAVIIGFIIVFFFLLIFICCIFISLRKTMKKIDGIEDVDLILQEAKLEQNSNSPKIKVDKSLFEINFKDITLISLLGNGGGSECDIFICSWKDNVCVYKGFKIQNFVNSEISFQEFEQEVKIYSSIRHPSILQFFGACVNLPNVGIIMEFCQSGDLSQFLSKYQLKNHKNYDFLNKIRILKEIANGIQYLHSNNIIHRDLKPENVLIDDKESAKIMDFGLSKFSNSENKTMTKRIGTSYYMAPEVIGGKIKYSNKIDVYSWAILAFVVVTEQFFPYGTNQNVSILNQVSKNPNFRPEIKNEEFENEKKFIVPIIKKNWSYDPNERNSFKEIVEELEKEEKKLKNNLPSKIKEIKSPQEMSLKELEEENRKLKKKYEIMKKKKILPMKKSGRKPPPLQIGRPKKSNKN